MSSSAFLQVRPCSNDPFLGLSRTSSLDASTSSALNTSPKSICRQSSKMRLVVTRDSVLTLSPQMEVFRAIFTPFDETTHAVNAKVGQYVDYRVDGKWLVSSVADVVENEIQTALQVAFVAQ